jgi:hypothetical protein
MTFGSLKRHAILVSGWWLVVGGPNAEPRTTTNHHSPANIQSSSSFVPCADGRMRPMTGQMAERRTTTNHHSPTTRRTFLLMVNMARDLLLLIGYREPI